MSMSAQGFTTEDILILYLITTVIRKKVILLPSYLKK